MAGGSAELWLSIPGYDGETPLALELSDPPTGVSIENVALVPEGLAMVLATKAGEPPVGLEDNLIIEVSLEPRGDSGRDKRRQPAGVLPALPIKIVGESSTTVSRLNHE